MSIFEYPLKIGDLFASLPIVQGGMGVKISGSGLASAVANQGGIGVIAAADVGMDELDFLRNPTEANIRGLRDEIRKAKKLTSGIIGVNIMVALEDYAILVKTAIEEGIDIIFSGAGLPLSLPGFKMAGSKTMFAPIVSSARAAGIIAKKWARNYAYAPDAVVVEGPKAGGHLGFKKEDIDNPEFALEKIVPEVVEVISQIERESGKTIPVIAAGGIYAGDDIQQISSVGCIGCSNGNRFVTTHECDADIKFKEAYLNAEQSDIMIIDSPVGMPGRAINNSFLQKVAQGTKIPINCPYKCLKTCKLGESPYCISFALMNAFKGKLNKGFAFCGTNAYRAKKIISVR